MKPYFFAFLFLFNTPVHAQQWFAEVSGGASSYNGDLTEKEFSIKRIGPMLGVNIKYNTGDFINFRGGLTYAKLGADDKNNNDPGLKSRRLNFKTNLLELNLTVEVNVLDPETYYSYPYIFGGVGVFHFNPYTYDDNGRKTFLQPLGTEGQGVLSYPDRKKYSLFQVCFPFGAGFKLNLSEELEVGFEFGYRILLTDYLDDVSKTYVNLKALQEANGAAAADLSYREQAPFLAEGEKRGNNGVRDSYFFAGIKIAKAISRKRDR